MSDEKRKVSYFNTLIFTIIAGIVSILLLVLLFFKGFNEYLPFIIALEVGIFSIIALCITQIILNERFLDKLKKNIRETINFNQCPDYYTKRETGDKEICSSDYIYKDKGNKNWIMKIYPEDDLLNRSHGSRPLPANVSLDYIGNEPKYEKFPLHEIENEPTFKTYDDKCAPLTTDPQDPKLSYLRGYNLVPWSTMNSKCASTFSSSI
jgi:hypothetical protein